LIDQVVIQVVRDHGHTMPTPQQILSVTSRNLRPVDKNTVNPG
jgi:hypothetical protein